MSIITLFAASHCHEEQVAQKLRKKQGYGLLNDEMLLSEASERFGVTPEKLRRAMHGPLSVFNRITHERESGIACIRAALAELIQQDDLVYHGLVGHLLPTTLPQVLRVCLFAEPEYRSARASEIEGVSGRAARKLVIKEDEERKRWTLYLFGLGPWDRRLYDIVIPMDHTTEDEAVDVILEQAAFSRHRSTPEAEEAARDFALAAKVQLALVESGHDVDLEVTAHSGHVTLTVNRFALNLEQLQEQLRAIAGRVPDVKDVHIRTGPHYRPSGRYEKTEEGASPKILLVDDEEEFVLTLSERLETRNLESAIAYDGEEALAIMKTDPPDVMVLDLRMPGLDGLEVLRRVRRGNRSTEVIILTGHGSEQEEELGMELGAFACLNKPVNIDVLVETMKQAYKKVREAEAGSVQG